MSPPSPPEPTRRGFLQPEPSRMVVPSRGSRCGRWGGSREAKRGNRWSPWPGGAAPIPVWTPWRREVGCREPTGDAKPLMPLGSAEMLRVEQEPPCPQRPLRPQGTIAAAWGTAEQDPTPAASHSRDLTPAVLPHHPRLLLLLVTARRGAPTGSPSMPHVGKKKHTDVNGLKRNCTELHQGVETRVGTGRQRGPGAELSCPGEFF